MAPSAIKKWATFALPTLAVAASAIVFLGPGKPRAAIGARVWGSPAEGAATLALRVEGVRRLYSVDDAVQLEGLKLDVRSAAGEPLGVWSGNAGPDGVAEAFIRLEKEASGPLDIRVVKGEDVLAEGRITRPLGEPTVVLPGVITGSVRGDCDVRVEAPRGHLVAPFEEELRVAVGGGVGGPGGGEASVEAVNAFGMEVRPERAILDASGCAALRVKALAHNVELSLKVTDRAGKSCVWEGYLPVVAGAMWLDPRGLPAELRIVSPAPRERAYLSLSLAGDQGRALGAIVPLARDDAGFYAGRFAVPEPLRSMKGSLYAIVAGDPYEQGAGTVAWPIAPPEGKVTPRRIGLLIDGMPAVEAREKERVGSARRAGVLVVAATALVEVFLLLLLGRSSRRKLAVHFAGAASSVEDKAQLLGSARESPLLGALIAVSLVALAFALVIAFATLR